MKIMLFDCSGNTENIKNEELFHMLNENSFEVIDEFVEDIDELTGEFDACCTVKVRDEIHTVSKYILPMILYNEYEIL